MVINWRKHPPTPDEVRTHPWWWHRRDEHERPNVYTLEIFSGDRVGIHISATWIDAWGGEWQAAVPTCDIPPDVRKAAEVTLAVGEFLRPGQARLIARYVLGRGEKK